MTKQIEIKLSDATGMGHALIIDRQTVNVSKAGFAICNIEVEDKVYEIQVWVPQLSEYK